MRDSRHRVGHAADRWKKMSVDHGMTVLHKDSASEYCQSDISDQFEGGCFSFSFLS